VRWVRGKAQIIVGNRRRGPTGIIELAFKPQVTQFSNLARDKSLAEHF
jgi:replicative DNA helicase